MASSANYRTDGGDTWVIGGKLVIEKGATVEGLPSGPAIETQAPSQASDVESLKSDFNELLNKLKTAGLMK